MKTIDWSKAPEGAQGFMPDDHSWIAGWWKQDAGSNYWWSFELAEQGGWEKSYAKPFDSPKFQKRPTNQSAAWNGQGLPPAGCKVEYLTYGNEWKGGTYVGQFNGQMVCGCDDSGVVGVVGSGQLRPISTPEQIAAEERKSEISFMASCIAHSNFRNTSTDNDIAAAAHLYYLGYRKP